LAYKYIEDEIQLVMLSTHENFYKSKKKLKGSLTSA